MGKPKPYPKLSQEQAQKFWAKTDQSLGPDGCWPWIAKAKTGAGRGIVRVNKQPLAAPRVAYELNHGPLPLDLLLYSTCQLPACVNPAHMRAGTQSDAQSYAYAAKHGAPMTPTQRKLAQRVPNPTTGAKPYPTLTSDEQRRFWAYVENSAAKPDECWVWTGARFEEGYGAFKVQGRVLRTHRIAYTLKNGFVSTDKVIRHLCANPPCCNPAHLAEGTQVDNAADRDAG